MRDKGFLLKTIFPAMLKALQLVVAGQLHVCQIEICIISIQMRGLYPEHATVIVQRPPFAIMYCKLLPEYVSLGNLYILLKL